MCVISRRLQENRGAGGCFAYIVNVGIVNDVTVRRTDKFTDHLALLGKDDGRSVASIGGGHVVAVTQDL